MSYSVVWFKRDLRWHDHAVLARAAKHGPVRCIYVIEPSAAHVNKWGQININLVNH